MRFRRDSLATWMLFLLSTALASAAPAEKRYEIQADPKTYPQAEPKQALASVIKAAEAGRIDYLLAHLAEPTWVDDRVKRVHAGQFDQLVSDAQDRLDPGTIKLLQRFLDKGTWSTEKGQTRVTLEDVKDRTVFLKQVDGRWYLEHREQP